MYRSRNEKELVPALNALDAKEINMKNTPNEEQIG